MNCLCRAIVMLISDPVQYEHLSILSKICSTLLLLPKSPTLARTNTDVPQVF